MARRTLFLAALATFALLAGCASSPETPKADVATSASKTLPEYYEAANRTRITCTSATPLSAQAPFESLPFDCPAMRQPATVSEMYDAGWRIESVNVGKETFANGVAQLPLTVTLRKLF